MKLTLDTITSSENIVDLLDTDTLQEISTTVIENYKTDEESRADWLDAYNKWMDMANQKMEPKNKPWPNASNIKYPLITQAALQFSARVVPALMPNAEPVGVGVVGPDPDGSKYAVAKKISGHMNYQCTDEMEEWEEDFDRLLMSAGISGIEFKKTYFDPMLGRNVSRHVPPTRLVINYFADTLENSRKTEIFYWSKNYILERMRSGVFATIPFDKMIGDPLQGKEKDTDREAKERTGLREGQADEATPYTVLEYHGDYDLDGDGYAEPYIITVMEDSGMVLQIIPRFDVDSIISDEEENLVRIVPFESYTKYGLIPNPDGSFYDLGFGSLLYPINATINTSINQLNDSGTLNNMNAGFVGKGIQMKNGIFSMSPGKWLSVNTTGDDLRKAVLPMPVKEPSKVLMELLTYMVEAGKELSATTDIFTGQHPGQNTKAGVTQAVRDEGQKVFTSIYKRIRRSLRKELQKIYELNTEVLNSDGAENTKIYQSAQIFQVDAEVYAGADHMIQPSADPNIAIKEQKLQKHMTSLQLLQGLGMGNLTVAARKVLDTLEEENIDLLLPEDAQPAADPKAQSDQLKLQLASQEMELDAQLEKAKLQQKAFIDQAKIELEILKADMAARAKGMDTGVKVADMENRLQIAREAKTNDGTQTTE